MTSSEQFAGTAGASCSGLETMGTKGRPAVFGVPSPRFDAAAAAYEEMQRTAMEAWRKYQEAEVAMRNAHVAWLLATEALTVARERFQRVARETQEVAT